MLNLIKEKFDIIIIGAGLSGLILADEISKKTEKSILIIEKKKKLATKRIGVFGINHKISLQINMTHLGNQ
jgi:predicted flavoprotein YhiN